MVSPQRAGGSQRSTRQIQRSIDQGNAVAVAAQRENEALRAELASTRAQVDGLLARIAALEVEPEQEELIIDGGAP